jgi:hypothetical protein
MESRGIPPEMSNFYCLPGRAGGTPNVLGHFFLLPPVLCSILIDSTIVRAHQHSVSAQKGR